ncbi:MAG: glycosyltransferase [Cyclobacteriaceae bacterium]
MIRISAVIITLNEEKNIGRCLESLRVVADEIVVVDSLSRDRTREICQSYHAVFIEQPFLGYVDQKNLGVARASHNYILALDADEYLSPELIESIGQAKQNPGWQGCSMNRLNAFSGKNIFVGGAYPDKKIRLWDREFGQWAGQGVHESVELQPGVKVIHLNGDLYHNSFRSIAETIDKLQSYSDIFAQYNRYKIESSFSKIVLKTAFSFFRTMLMKGGLTQGYEGLIMSFFSVQWTYYKYAKLFEANQRLDITLIVVGKDPDGPETAQDFQAREVLYTNPDGVETAARSASHEYIVVAHAKEVRNPHLLTRHQQLAWYGRCVFNNAPRDAHDVVSFLRRFESGSLGFWRQDLIEAQPAEPIGKKVLLEMTKLRNMNSGLGQFCHHLGNEFARHNRKLDLLFYVPTAFLNAFGARWRYKANKSYHRLLMNRPDVDVWHCLQQGSPYWPTNPSTKVVLTVHDLNFMVKYTGWRRDKEIRKLQRNVDRAHAIVTVSNFTKQDLISYIKVDEKKIHVIHNGGPVRSASLQARRPEFMTEGKFLFTIGIVNPKKNFHTILPILQSNPNVKLVIAGDKSHPYSEEILEAARKMGVADRLIMPGAVLESEKLWLYQHCEAFLFPSLSEGFGLPVLEAMSEGKPVFISRLTSLPEVGGPLANYFENFEPQHMNMVFTQGMRYYEASPTLREEMKRWAASFSWEAAARKYLLLYESLC